MQGISLKDIMFVHAAFAVDETRLATSFVEPRYPDGTEDSARERWNDLARQRARNTDEFADLMVLSTAVGWAYTHYVVEPPNHPDWKLGVHEIVPTTGFQSIHSTMLCPYGSEAEVLQAFWAALDPRNGIQYVAGWQLTDQVLPRLINKAHAGNVFVPDAYKTDITRRFGQTDAAIDVDRIYMQGARPSLRELPPLSAVLRHWGVPQPTATAYPEEHELIALSHGDWVRFGCKAVETYLWGMQYLVGKYYGYTDGLGRLQNM